MKQHKDNDGIYVPNPDKPVDNNLWIHPDWDNKFIQFEPTDTWAKYFEIIKEPKTLWAVSNLGGEVKSY